jgi:hypothetical protein
MLRRPLSVNTCPRAPAIRSVSSDSDPLTGRHHRMSTGEKSFGRPSTSRINLTRNRLLACSETAKVTKIANDMRLGS